MINQDLIRRSTVVSANKVVSGEVKCVTAVTHTNYSTFQGGNLVLSLSSRFPKFPLTSRKSPAMMEGPITSSQGLVCWSTQHRDVLTIT